MIVCLFVMNVAGQVSHGREYCPMTLNQPYQRSTDLVGHENLNTNVVKQNIIGAFTSAYYADSHANLAHLNMVSVIFVPWTSHGSGIAQLLPISACVDKSAFQSRPGSEDNGVLSMWRPNLNQLKRLFGLDNGNPVTKHWARTARPPVLDPLESRLLLSASIAGQYSLFAVDVSQAGIYAVDVYQSPQQFPHQTVTNLVLGKVDAAIPVVVHLASSPIATPGWTLVASWNLNLNLGRTLVPVNLGYIAAPVFMAAPTAPGNLCANVSSYSAIQLAWTDNSDNETSFRIERQTSGSGSWSLLTATSARVTSFIDSTVQPSTMYAYRVLAANRAGTSLATNVATGTTPEAPPAAPGNLVAKPFSAIRIDLTWADNSNNETGFVVDRSTDGVNFVPVVTLPANTKLFSDTGLKPGTKYNYRVRAENAGGAACSTLNVASTLANNTVGGDGWTVVVPSADTLIIYVSSSTGNDTNNGLSAAAPVKTIAKGYSLLRRGMPDELLLKRGDTFSDVLNWAWDKSGRSINEPMLISAYGIGFRPIIASGAGHGLSSDHGSSDIDIIGLDLYSNGRDPSVPGYSYANNTGISWLAPTGVQGKNLLIEDCSFRFYGTNISIQGYGGGSWSNVAIRRNVVVDAWNLEATHSQGAFLTSVNGLYLDGNVFDHNGWNENIVGAGPTVYNHNVYITSACTGVVVRNNTFANASSHGIQARSGGDIENNLFINNPIGMSYGLVNGGSNLTAGGVSGTISGNVFLGGRDIAGSPRGWCIDIANLKAAADGGGTVIRDNVFANDNQGHYAAIQLNICDGAQPNFATSPGLNDLTIEGNVVYNWYRALWLNSDLVPGGTGPKSLNGLVVQNNDFQHMTANTYSAIIHGPAFSSLKEQFSGNHYWPATFYLAGANKTLSQWQAEVEATAQAVQVAYLDPTRDVARYNSGLGGVASVDAFLATARQQTAQSWSSNYTAEAAINYIRKGFGKPALPK